ncbi:MAG: arsenate reductase/protein-tyrosine-phosphatase family protein [Promethearchaeota archaeon]
MGKIKKVLFICYGNTARSPVAWALARDLKKIYRELSEVEFDSAGFINAFSYMQPESRAFLDAKNIFHSDFVPKIINRRLLANQDLILTMEKVHKQQILEAYGNIEEIRKKVFTLKEFNGEKEEMDIIDPYYTDSKTYEKILKIIESQVKEMVQKIIRINRNKKT